MYFYGSVQLGDVVRGHMAFRYFTQGKYGIFIFVAGKKFCRAVAQLARARCCQQNQLQAALHAL